MKQHKTQPRTGIWVWPDLPAARGAKQTVAEFAEAGITDIFLLVKGLSGKASCAKTGGVLGVAWPDRDILAEMLKAAHAKGMRLHAWLTSASDALYKAAHPESGLWHFARGQDRDIISIADEGYIQYMEGFVSALSRQYALDGLHLDYIRYNHLTYGWSPGDKARYAAAGADIARLEALMCEAFYTGEPSEAPLLEAYREGDASVRILASVRRTLVVAFATRMITAARAARPGLCISAALMPEGAYADTAFSDLHYGQNYRDAAGLYDLALPMVYSQAYGKDAAWVREVAQGTVGYGLRALIGLHAYEGGTGQTLAADIQAVAELGSRVEGMALFRAGTVAFAYLDGQSLRIRNALEEPIVRVTAEPQEGPHGECALTIPPGGEATLKLSAKPTYIRIFTQSNEACVWTQFE